MPTAVETYPKPTLADLKNSMVKDGHPAKVVPDDFMYEFRYPVDLPTIERLGGYKFDIKTDTINVAQTFVDDWQAAMANNDAEAFTGLFLPDGVWRDKIVYSWEYRTFNGQASIAQAAEDLFPRSPSKKFRLLEPTPSIQDPYPDLNYLQLHVSFETDVVGASAVVNLVNTADGVKIWTLHTVIESLHEFPELPNRDGHMVGPLSWLAQREIDTRFDDSDPQVVIVGGGHNGLMMAARLKALGVPALVIERNERIGDNWRKRYEALSLHFPHWADHLPYMPYPDHWPVYTPAAKLGDWLEWYASAMELYTWTDSNVTSCSQNETTGEWTLGIDRGGKENRTLHPKHVVMATSLAGVPMLPKIPGMDTFKGTIRHSTAHDSSREWIGKKVMVVGTSSSGFDTAYDFARRGIDITILQRSPTYLMSLTHSVPKIIGIYEPKDGSRPSLDIADRIAYSMPVGPGEELGRRLAEDLATLDKDLIDGMESAGFKTYRGQRGTGTQTLGYTRNGGFYFDAGACEQVMNGKIRVEQGSIDRFAEDKVILNGNRDQHYDLVVMATGFSNTIDSVRRTLGQDIADRCKPIWGMDAEGELNSAWRNCGVPNLWIMVGTLQHGRYHSKRVALRIKAMLEGVAKKPYEA